MKKDLLILFTVAGIGMLIGNKVNNRKINEISNKANDKINNRKINISKYDSVITLSGTYTDGSSFNRIFTNETDAKSFIPMNKYKLKTIKIDDPNGMFTNCSYMFDECVNLVDVDLSTFNMSNVNYLYAMFANCISLRTINLSSSNIANVINMELMCYNCNSLRVIDLSNVIISKDTKTNDIFYQCNSLITMYARTKEDCDILNTSTSKPSNINFKVKS